MASTGLNLSYGGPSPTILTPASATSVYSSPAPYGVKAEPDDEDDSSSTSSATAHAEPARKKQKRNKPTLSCHECVERKTKNMHTFGPMPGYDWFMVSSFWDVPA
ncbi:hypothetical protein BJ170DRAFT_592157 [Xylariales sp. AK1849]|nr:hypothetical protein BJ170DRAFT_592157 [Xylariales sp. AK1849]